MKLERTTIDRTTLPTDLLPEFKRHCRVEFARDDDYLTSALKRSFDLFERLTQFRVFLADYDWIPENATGKMPVPVQPVESFKVFDADGTDVSSNFELAGIVASDEMAPQWLQPIDGASWPAGARISFVTGYPSGDDLPPGILDICFRIGAFLYENREMVAIGGVDVMPYANSLITGYWIPRA